VLRSTSGTRIFHDLQPISDSPSLHQTTILIVLKDTFKTNQIASRSVLLSGNAIKNDVIALQEANLVANCELLIRNGERFVRNVRRCWSSL
jgi:hypothetical protein